MVQNGLEIHFAPRHPGKLLQEGSLARFSHGKVL